MYIDTELPPGSDCSESVNWSAILVYSSPRGVREGAGAAAAAAAAGEFYIQGPKQVHSRNLIIDIYEAPCGENL